MIRYRVLPYAPYYWHVYAIRADGQVSYMGVWDEDQIRADDRLSHLFPLP